MRWRPLTVGLVAFALPLAAAAIPLLQMVLQGDASRLGTGGQQPFFNEQLAALHLDRPALLTSLRRPVLRLEVQSEKAIDLGGPQFFGGTRAEDQRARALLAIPTELGGRRVTFLALGESSAGILRLQNEADGLIVKAGEPGIGGAFAIGAEPWDGLRVGGTLLLGGLPSYAVEAIGSFGPLELGAQQRREDLGETLKLPSGPPARFRRPELNYPIHSYRETNTLTARMRTSWSDASAAIDLSHSDPTVDVSLFPAPWLALRSRYEQLRLSFDDWASNKGVPIAQIDLDLTVTRWAVGADLKWGRMSLFLRLGETALTTASHWRDNGEMTGMQLLNLPIDLGLSLQQSFRARVRQWSFGSLLAFAPFTASLGIQHMSLHNDAGGYSYGSSVNVALAGGHIIAPANLEAVAFTAGLSCVVARTTIHIAVAQMAPITGPPGGVFTPRPTRPSGSRADAPAPAPAPTTDGGRLLSFDVNQTF